METLRTHPCIARYPGNPILSREDLPYPSDLTFNAGVIPWQGGYAMVFRNDYGYDGRGFKGTNIGLAFSPDGLHWHVEPEPVLEARDEEVLRFYDPRLTVIDDEIFMCFAADTKHGLRGGIARTYDLRHFEVLSLSVPDNRNMVLFPEKIGGMYMRLERPMPVYSRGRDRFDIWQSESPDLIHWGNSHLVAAVEDFPFANDKIGPGAPPVRTRAGWLAACHAVDRDDSRGKNGWEEKWTKRYCATIVLLDLDEPWKMIGHGRVPLLVPEAPYEAEQGFRTQVAFPTAMLRMSDGTIRIYYGAADTVVALATAREEDLIELCLKGE